MAELILYRFEARGIQSFVFATTKLREIVGATRIVRELTNEDGLLGQAIKRTMAPGSKLAVGDRILYAAAGGATLQFLDEGELRRFAALWPRLVARTAPGLQVVQAWIMGENTAAGLTLLAERLRAARNVSAHALPRATPIMDRAPRTGMPAHADARAARALWKVYDEDALLDAGTCLRRAARDLTNTPVEQRLEDELPDSAAGFAGDEQEIGGSERSYLAVVHADGNRIGASIAGMSPTELKEFSSALNEATVSALGCAIDILSRSSRVNPGEPFPLRPIVLGGDDVTLIVRADMATTVARLFCQQFHNETSKFHPGGLTASAGIAFVKVKHPFHLAYELADELCSEAKAVGRLLVLEGDGALPPPSLVSFQRVTNSLSESARSLRTGDRLPLGPYRIDDSPAFLPALEATDALVAALLDPHAPAGALRDLVSLAQADPSRAASRFDRIRTVAASGPAPQRRAWAALSDAAERVLPGSSDALWVDARRLSSSGTELEDCRVIPWADVYTLSTFSR